MSQTTTDSLLGYYVERPGTPQLPNPPGRWIGRSVAGYIRCTVNDEGASQDFFLTRETIESFGRRGISPGDYLTFQQSRLDGRFAVKVKKRNPRRPGPYYNYGGVYTHLENRHIHLGNDICEIGGYVTLRTPDGPVHYYILSEDAELLEDDDGEEIRFDILDPRGLADPEPPEEPPISLGAARAVQALQTAAVAEEGVRAQPQRHSPAPQGQGRPPRSNNGSPVGGNRHRNGRNDAPAQPQQNLRVLRTTLSRAWNRCYILYNGAWQEIHHPNAVTFPDGSVVDVTFGGDGRVSALRTVVPQAPAPAVRRN